MDFTDILDAVFRWNAATNAQIFVATATLMLAIVTVFSVRAASKSARATENIASAAERQVTAALRQNELTEKTMLASIQPLLSDFPRDQFSENVQADSPADERIPWADLEASTKASREGMHIWSGTLIRQAPDGITGWGITTLFKNVGIGPAIVERATLELEGITAAYETKTSKLLILRGDYCRVTFNVIANDFPDPLKGGGWGRDHSKPDFFVDIYYSNLSGSGRLKTRQRIQFIRESPYIAAVEIWDQESGKRLTVSEYNH